MYCIAAHGTVYGVGGSTQYEGKHPVGPSVHVAPPSFFHIEEGKVYVSS